MNLRDKSRMKYLAKILEAVGKDQKGTVTCIGLSETAYEALLQIFPDIKAEKIGRTYLVSKRYLAGTDGKILDWLLKHPERSRLGQEDAV